MPSPTTPAPSPTTPAPSRIGAHVKSGGGLARRALPYLDEVGAEAVQVFIGNPRGWRTSPGDPAEDAAFRAGCAERGAPVFLHAPYLINLGSPSPVTAERSAESLAHALQRALALGAEGVVVHAGSAVDESHVEAAMTQVGRLLLPLLDVLPDDGPRVLIEPTAGGGRPLAARVEQLEAWLAALDDHPLLGVCLDTCHAFAAGHDLAAPGGLTATLDALVAAVGQERLGLVHANDSRDPRGSCRDRHTNLGSGTIGLEPFADLFTSPVTAGVPIVVETPGDADGHRGDIAALRRLQARALGSPT